MREENIIVAAEISQADIKVLYASKKNDGAIKTLSIEKNELKDKDQLSFLLKQNCNLIQNIIDGNMEVNAIYLNIAGHSIFSTIRRVSKNYGTAMSINQNDLNMMGKEVEKEFDLDDKHILKVIPQSYIVDDVLVDSPIAKKCNSLQGEYLIVYCNKSMVESIENAFDLHPHIEMRGMYIAIEQKAEKLLSEQQKQQGVALIDFAETSTSIIVYSNKVIQRIVVIPFGVDNIVNDIANECQIHKQSANLLLQQKVSAFIDESKEGKMFNMKNKQGESTSILYSVLMEIALARIEEIIGLCHSEIKHCIALSDLGAGIVLSGAGVAIPDIESYVSQQLDLEVIVEPNTNAKHKEKESIDITALMRLIETGESCVDVIIEKEEPPKPQKTPKKKKLGGGVMDLFGWDR